MRMMNSGVCCLQTAAFDKLAKQTNCKRLLKIHISIYTNLYSKLLATNAIYLQVWMLFSDTFLQVALALTSPAILAGWEQTNGTFPFDVHHNKKMEEIEVCRLATLHQ